MFMWGFSRIVDKRATGDTLLEILCDYVLATHALQGLARFELVIVRFQTVPGEHVPKYASRTAGSPISSAPDPVLTI